MTKRVFENVDREIGIASEHKRAMRAMSEIFDAFGKERPPVLPVSGHRIVHERPPRHTVRFGRLDSQSHFRAEVRNAGNFNKSK